MRALVVAGFFLFGGQLFATSSYTWGTPSAMPHLCLGAGFVTLGAMLFAKPRWIRIVAAIWIAFTVAGRIHFLANAEVWTRSNTVLASVFFAWAVAAFVWLIRTNPRDARN